LIRRFGDESGYSLVEVLASIMILAIAIIPMVGMFDTALRSASLGANYDTARTLANKQLERAKGLPYDTVENNFPFNTPTAAMTGGTYTSPTPITSVAVPHEVPQGFRYTVTKQYKAVPASGNTVNLANSTTDQGIIEVKVTVSWGDNSYTATGVKAR
jgi:prepilin-type N-terminal cleavage/methylation domain-containing protein